MGAVSLVHSIGNIAHETTTKSEVSMKTLFLTLSILFVFASCKNNPTQRNQMNEKLTNKQEVLALGIRQQLNIPQDLILPFDSVGMDSLFGEYKRNVEECRDGSEGEDYEEDRIDERRMDIFIPYAFNDLLKRGFKPISAQQFEQKLNQLRIAPEQRKRLPAVYEHKHYFTIPSCVEGWHDDLAEGGMSKEDEDYVKHGNMNYCVIKGYNFIVYAPMLIRFIKRNKEKLYFRLKDNIVHINLFLLNGSKSSLTWLRHNSPLFLKDMVMTFGYDKNTYINKFVLDETLKEVDLKQQEVWCMEKIFVRKIYAKKPYIDIREGLLKTLLDSPVNDKDEKWIFALNTYGRQIMEKKSADTPSWIRKYTMEERYKIAAYIGYYLIKLIKKYDFWLSTSYASELYYNEKFRKYLDAHNYFNLPGFIEMSDSLYQEYDFDVEVYRAREAARSSAEE